MTNLADLLPAGGGQNNTDFVADGNISAGVPVVLTAAGKAAPISSSSASLGSEYEFESGSTRYIASCFAAADDDVVVVVYQDDANSDYGTVVVGQIYGNGLISYGTPVVFNSAETKFMDVCWDSSTGSGGGGKVVITYSNLPSSSGYGTAAVGTLSGTSISMGAATAFYSGSTEYTSCDYDASADRILVAYRDASSGLVGKAISGEISGTSISFAGSSYTWSGSNLVSFIVVSYDTTAQKSVIMARDNSAGTGTSIVASVSGTTVSYGSLASFNTSAGANYCTAVYDSSGDKTLVFFSDATTTKGTASVGTVSGTEITWTTPVIFHNNDAAYMGAAYSSYANKTIIAYSDQSDSYKGKYNEVTLSGTSLSFGAQGTFESDSNCYHVSACPSVYGSVYKIGIFYQEGTGGAGTSVAIEPSTSTLTSTNLLGLAPEAISDTATGTINTWGSRVTGLKNASSTMSFGSPVNFDGSGWKQKNRMAYDTTNNRVVNIYEDNTGTGYVTAVVGTVSGTTTEWGTAVVVKSAATNGVSIAYDANAQKMVAYYNSGSAHYARVGTVSGSGTGATISFGTEVTVVAANADLCAIAYDANAQKVVVTVEESSVLKALVGTVAGTDITFGTAASFYSGDANNPGPQIAYDANAQKVVIQYTKTSDSYGYAIVGTIAGTDITFGTEASYYAATNRNNDISYDSTAQKLFLSFRDSSNNSTGIVGTIAGTDITFGAVATAITGGTQGEYSRCVYDPDNDITIVVGSVNSVGTVAAATISGTSVSFSSPQTFNAFSTSEFGLTYDATANKAVVVYAYFSGAGISPAVVITTATPIVIGTDYYVQTDGSLSTDTGGQLIGKAITTTQINIKDYTG